MKDNTQSKDKVSDLYVPIKKFINSTESSRIIEQSCLDDAWFYTVGDKTTYRVAKEPDVYEFAARVIDALNSGSGECISSDDVNDIQLEVTMPNESKAFCRVHKEHGTSYGYTLSVRVQPETPPLLEEMALPMGLFDLLMHRSLERGGLVIAVAGLGAGKTTTISGTVVSRLTEFGGQAVSIEDPPEHNLMGVNNGFWGKGKIIQKAVLSSRGEKFSDAVRASLRMFPATPGNLLFLGEIRDGDTAEYALNAASNGSLVLATVHGNDVASGLDRFLSYTIRNLGRELAYNMLRDSLRISIFQELTKMRDGGGEGDWGDYAPKVSLLHNLFHNGKLNEAIAGGFNPDDGVKKGLRDILKTQQANISAGAYLLNLVMKNIIAGKSPDDVMKAIRDDGDSRSPAQFGLQLHDIAPVYDYLQNNEFTDAQKKRLIRPGIEWQNNFEPPACIDLRKKVVRYMLDNYYSK